VSVVLSGLATIMHRIITLAYKRSAKTDSDDETDVISPGESAKATRRHRSRGKQPVVLRSFLRFTVAGGKYWPTSRIRREFLASPGKANIRLPTDRPGRRLDLSPERRGDGTSAISQTQNRERQDPRRRGNASMQNLVMRVPGQTFSAWRLAAAEAFCRTSRRLRFALGRTL